MAKSSYPQSPWMRNRVIFHMLWRVYAYNGWIATDDRIFFLLFLSFLSSTVQVYNCPLCLLFFNFSPYSLNFLFYPYSFYRSFVFFSILSFNYNLSYVLFFISIFIHLISYFVFIPFIVSVLLNLSLFLVDILEFILFILILVIFSFVWVLFIYNLVLQF